MERLSLLNKKLKYQVTKNIFFYLSTKLKDKSLPASDVFYFLNRDNLILLNFSVFKGSSAPNQLLIQLFYVTRRMWKIRGKRIFFNIFWNRFNSILPFPCPTQLQCRLQLFNCVLTTTKNQLLEPWHNISSIFLIKP